MAFDPDQNFWDFNENRLYQTEVFEEHTFMDLVRSNVLAYRVQSACHFDVSIEVHQAAPLKFDATTVKLTPSFRVEVAFLNFAQPNIYRMCRPRFLMHSRTGTQILTDEVQIYEKGRFVSMKEFLSVHYPTFNELVKPDEMQRWWDANGKTFNWTGLPTELKQQVILFCLHHPRGPGRYQRSLQNHRSPFNPRPVADREIGVCEIIDKLGDWFYLLGVSHQVRTITLRLCFLGSSGVAYSKGLCIDTLSYGALEECIHRLGKYYQMMGPDSLPVDQKTRALARCYSNFPKIYPQLKQYATFRHGIQKICLRMSFIAYMRFFKVTTGGFRMYWRSDHMTFDIFEQMPVLNEIVIKLPVRPRGAGGWKDDYYEGGPQLIHHESPCPRKLHRIVYERIAQALAPYKHVHVIKFIDDDEKQRFLQLRRDATKKLKFTSDELENLYADDGGGISLEDVDTMANTVVDSKSRRAIECINDDDDEDDGDYDGGKQRFFPPECHCVKSCTFYGNV